MVVSFDKVNCDEETKEWKKNRKRMYASVKSRVERGEWYQKEQKKQPIEFVSELEGEERRREKESK